MGNTVPEKNMKRNSGKFPTTSTSFTDLVSPARIRLNPITERQVSRHTRRNNQNEPEKSNSNR